MTALRRWFLETDTLWHTFGQSPVGSGAPSTVTPVFTAAVTGSQVRVDATGSTSTGSTVASYGWDFGDGTSGTGAVANHTYLTGGSYPVAVTVTDDRGTSATVSHTVTVSAPVARFAVNVTTLTAAFDGTGSTDIGSTITGYAWTYGDGTSGTGATVSHTYATSGNYTVTLTVTDAAGSTATTSRAVSVAQPVSVPTAAFTTAVSTYVATFDGSASGSTNGATITGWAWTFGDGATGTGRTVSHTYAAGTWTAQLTVTDSQGRTATVSHPVTVTAPANQPPTAGFTVTPNGLTVTFTSTSTDGDGSIAGTAWTFGDGGTGAGSTVSHTYTAGTYTVRCTVTDNLGAQGSTTKTVTVTAPVVPDTDYITGPPVTSLTLHPSSVAAVLQAIVHVPETGGYYTAQVHPESNGDESTRVSRISATGALLDEMMLTRAGHGTTLQIEMVSGVAYVWVTWEIDAAGTKINNVVRFPYKAGTYDYTTVPGKVVKIVGPTYRHVGFDTYAGYGWVRTLGSTADVVRRYPIADVRAGTLGTALNTITLIPGLWRQGWTSYYDSFFLLRGAPSDDGSVPQQIVETGWKSGNTIRTVDIAKVTGSSLKTEPEGMCVYFPGAQPRLQFGVTLGPVGGPHTYPTFDIPLALQGQQTRTSLVAGTYIPDSSTTGLLPGWTEAKLTVVTGTGGNLQLTAGQVIENSLIKARVLRPATGSATLRNCVITGELYPYASKATASALVDCTAATTGTLLIEDCLLEARGSAVSYYVTGVHGFNYTARRLRIRHTVDGFGVVNTHNSNGAINTVIEGCYVNDLAYYSPDPTHADNHTHNDGVQIFGNSGLIIRGNRIECILDTTFANGNLAGNSLGGGKAIGTGQAIAYTPTAGVITATNVWGNYLDGGQQSITAIPTPKGGSAIGNIHDNRFGRNQITKGLNSGAGTPFDSGSKKRPIVIDPGDTATGIAPISGGAASKVDTNGNVYADTGAPITDYVTTGA